YLQQENYTTGTRYGIIGLFVIGPLASVMAVLILAAIALAVLEFGDPGRPWQGALYMTAGALAVTTPHYQWYSLLLVMLVALDGRPEWLAFAAGGYYAAEAHLGRYTPPWRLVNAIAYGVPLVVVAIGWLVRHELARRALARGTAADAVPVETGPVEALPTRALLAERLPTRSLPVGSVPVGPVPVGPLPAETAPAGSAADVGREVPVLPMACPDRAFLPLGYPPAKHQTSPADRTVNRDMSYDP